MRIWYRLLRAVIVVLMLLVGTSGTAVIVSQTAWFKNWLRGYIVAEAHKYVNGQVSIERLGGNLFFGVELEGIEIAMDGSPVVSVKDIGLGYNLFQLVTKGLSLDELRINGLMFHLRREPDGTWSVARLIKKQEQEADREGPAYPISINDIGISNASITIDGAAGSAGVTPPTRIDRLDAKLAFHYEPVRYTIDITHTSFRASDPAIGVNALSGHVSVKDDTVFLDSVALRTEETSVSLDGAVQHYLTTPVLNLKISSDKTSLPELAHVIPALAGIELQPAYELKLDGPLDRLGIDMNVRSSAGQLTGTLIADAMAPGQSASGTLAVRHLDLGKLLKDSQQPRDLTADIVLDLQSDALSDLDSVSGTVSVVSPHVVAFGYTADRIKADARIEGRRVALNGRASAYGADVTTKGRVVVPRDKEALAFDLRGNARHVDLRRLPHQLGVPDAPTDINADYQVAGTTAAMRGHARFADSTVAEAKIASGSTADFEKGAGAGQLAYSADATVSDLDLQRIGAAFHLPALAADRYQSNFNGHVALEGRGVTVPDLSATARGTLTESSVLGGRLPQLNFDASFANDVVHVTADGAFTDFDPAVVSGQPAMKGTVGGVLNVDATVTGVSGGVGPDNVAGHARMTLDRSTVGGLAIDRASLDADYERQAGEIRTLEIVGADLHVTAAGTLALNETGQSKLEVHADTPSLQTIGGLFDIPVTGGAKVDAMVTGNRTELQATGTFVGNSLAYEGNEALTAASDYTVKVPDLAFDRATIVADTRATFVTVGGQNINELAAKTTYADKEIAFDATATQPDRSVAVAGALAVHPEHQEVHLERLTLATAGQEWTLGAGGQPAISYAKDGIIVVDGLTLASGDQQVTAEGTFGRSDDALKVTLTNVNLASVDALLLRPPQFTGRVNASSTVSGTTEAPTVKGQFEVAQGAFREFHYDTLKGTVDYAGKGLTLDATLQQNATQWITAKGYIPAALFTASPEESDGQRPHIEPATAADRIDLTVESSPIDLGLIQGLTTQLTDVQGTFQAHLRVTGSSDDPHPEGSMVVADGKLTVVPTGVAYKNIAGTIEFQPDRVHINQITVLDNHDEALSITGDLAVHGGAVGGVDLWVNSNDFKIIDNKMGNVRVQSAMQIQGELRSPIVRGDLGLSTGQVDLDEILALLGPSAYATEQTEYEKSQAPDGDSAARGPLFDRLRLDVRLGVPNDLVVRARALQAPGAPVALGALNVTLGGDLRATKEPRGPVLIVGAVTTIRGTYDFQGRRFEILRDGSVRFLGLDELDPTLDIRTRRIIQSVEARVNVRGTLSQPEIMLSGPPPLEEADILALILFNQSVNQLGESQQISLGQHAQGLLTGVVANELSRSIGNALNLNTFEISLAPENGGAAQVALGQQLGQDLYVGVQQGIGDQSSTNFILEYELTNWLRLQTTVVQGSTQTSPFRRQQSTGGDLIFFFSR